MEAAKLKLDESDLGGAISAAIETVKKEPTNVSARTFLFELSCFSGDWERAEKQLDAIGHQDPNAGIGSLIYRQNFKCERDRANVFEHSSRPEFVSGVPDYVEDLVKAVDLVRRGETAAARETLDKVEEERPAFSRSEGPKTDQRRIGRSGANDRYRLPFRRGGQDQPP